MEMRRIRSLAVMLIGVVGLASGAMASQGSGVVVLHPSAGGALSMSGSAKLIVPAGALYVNSSASDAVKGSGRTTIDSQTMYIRGGIQNSGQSICYGHIVRVSGQYEDPLAALAIPSTVGATSYGDRSISGGTVVLQPGRYGTISISSSAHVTFQPGVYHINGSGLNISGQPTIVGNGVTLIINTGSVSLSGQARLMIAPPTSGPLAGISLTQPAWNTSAISLSGDANLSMLGTIYAPQAHLSIGGGSTIDGEGPQVGDLMVVRSISISGQGTIRIGRNGMRAIELMSIPLAD